MHVVHSQNSGHVVAQQGGRRAEEHDEYHVEIAQNGFPLEKGLQTDVGTWRMKLLPQEKGDEQRSYHDVGADFG